MQRGTQSFQNLLIKSKIWPSQIFLKLKFSYINQGPWTWNKRNYINICHGKKVFIVNQPYFSGTLKSRLGLQNKLFSYERYWCNSFRFLSRVLDLYKKISISRNSEVVKFSAIVLWNLNFKMVETSFCARYNKNIGAIF